MIHFQNIVPKTIWNAVDNVKEQAAIEVDVCLPGSGVTGQLTIAASCLPQGGMALVRALSGSEPSMIASRLH